MKDTLYSKKTYTPFNQDVSTNKTFEKCFICNKNITSSCSVHKPDCPYSCNYNSIPAGDMFPLFIFAFIYLFINKIKKYYGKSYII